MGMSLVTSICNYVDQGTSKNVDTSMSSFRDSAYELATAFDELQGKDREIAANYIRGILRAIEV